MTTYAWPSSDLFKPAEAKLLIMHNQAVTESVLSGAVQVLSRPGARWGWDLILSDMVPDELAQVEAFIIRLSGRQHYVTLIDPLRPVPRGTINLSGVTTTGTTAQFATSVVLAGCGNTTTLLAGDWIKIGTQLVMVMADATASSGGAMTVEFRHPLRASVTGGTSVTTNGPTSTYILAESGFESARQSGFAQPGSAFRFIEIF